MPTFTRFPELPFELRQLIWLFASFNHRTIPIAVKRLHSLKRSITGEFQEHPLYRFRSDIPIPALFSVCKGARSEAKKHFKRAVGASYTFRFFSITLLPRFYTNSACDTICPVGPYSLPMQKKLLEGMHRSQLQHIAFDDSHIDINFSSTGLPLAVRSWIQGITRPPHPLKSVTLFIVPRNITPYRTGSRTSFADPSPFDWNDLSPHQQCTLCVAISRFARTVATLRHVIPHQIVHDDLREASGLPRELLLFSDLGAIKVCGSPESLRAWTPPRLVSLVRNIPTVVGSLLNSGFSSRPYCCDSGVCRACFGAGGFMI